MPLVKYGGHEEPGFELVQDEQLIVVRTRSQRSLRSGSTVAEPIEEELDGCELIGQFPEAGVEIYRGHADESVSDMDARKESLRRHPDVRFAGGVLVDTRAGEPVLYTENLFIKFRDNVEPDVCEGMIRDAGWMIKEKLGFSVNSYFVQATEGTGQRVFDMALEMLAKEEVEYCHPELIHPRESKLFFPQQWHLAPAVVAGIAINNHAHVDSAHELSMGEGVTIAVIDDGVDLEHPEFNREGKIVAPWNAFSGSSEARPQRPSDNHGTACAGVACAEGVDGAAGVAPRARLMPIRLVANLGSIAEAKAFQWAADHGADVISCSWGPPDGRWYNPDDPRHLSVYPLPASTRAAIDYAVETGRAGRGCVILFAAGNGNETVENDGYASYDKVLAVAACNDQGKRSAYSDFGASIWCSFPSSDFEFPLANHPPPLTSGIWTTDRTGASGYNPGGTLYGDLAGNYANDFGGTSSSCPGVAGVVALMLSVNPELTWIEVRDRLRDACDQIDTAGGNYQNGHSVWYGYGRINARRAVELARPVARQRLEIARSFFAPIADRSSTEVSLDVSESAVLSDLDVVLKIEHSHIADLVVQLIPPGAAQRPVNLHLREGGGQRNLERTYRASMHSGLNRLLGINCQGTWTLHVEDQAIRDTGVIQLFGLNLTLSNVKPAAVDRPMAERQAGRRAVDSSVPEKKKKTGKQKQKGAKKKGVKRRQRKSN